MTTTTLIDYTCNICETVAKAMKTFAYRFGKTLETIGTARAAAELTRMGYHKQAEQLMRNQMDLK